MTEPFQSQLERLLAFCNDLRRAGGIEELSELLPGVPHSPTQCLVARNLNFECRICHFSLLAVPNGTISSNDERLVKAAKELRLNRPSFDRGTRGFFSGAHVYMLPRDIAQIARDFDLDLYPTALYIDRRTLDKEESNAGAE